MTPAWYFRRLQTMDTAEVFWRLRTAAAQGWWRTRRRKHWRVPHAEARWAGGGVLPFVPSPNVGPNVGSKSLVAAAERILDGSWPIFEAQANLSGDSPDWFLDPATGRRAPSGTYCFAVPYRDEDRVGNAKCLWELSRLHHISVLAAAYQQTGDARYARRALAHHRSWCEANPPLSGIHWVSGIEIGIRLITWVWTRRLLAGFPDVADAFERDLLFQRQLHAHQSWLATFRSRGSSANNHLVAEMAGLLAASLAFPIFRASSRWAQLAADTLVAQIEQQTFADGINKEMAAGYHVFALELFLIAGCEADAAGSPLSNDYWRTVCAMADALAATVDAGLSTARQGDGDDGRALILDAPGRSAARAVLEASARVLKPLAWWPALPMEGVGALLLGQIARQRDLTPERPAARPSAFPAAGVTILRMAGGEDEIWCRVDHGPHGYLATAAHAHADALSFELRLGGDPILVDAGTYCYHGEAAWRDYFRSTIAHNTLEIHGRNQALHAGPFLWRTQSHTRLLLCSGIDEDEGDRAIVDAAHDGYAPEGIIHRRKIVLHRRGRALDITDTIEAAPGDAVPAPVAVRLAFNLHPRVACELTADRAELSWDAASGGPRQAVLALARSLRWSVHRGEENPILGWYSARFGHKEPASLLLGTGFVLPGQVLNSRLDFERAGLLAASASLAHAGGHPMGAV